MASNTPISQALSHVSGQMAEYAMLGEGSQVLSEIENEHHFLSEFGESIVRAAILLHYTCYSVMSFHMCLQNHCIYYKAWHAALFLNNEG